LVIQDQPVPKEVLGLQALRVRQGLKEFKETLARLESQALKARPAELKEIPDRTAKQAQREQPVHKVLQVLVLWAILDRTETLVLLVRPDRRDLLPLDIKVILDHTGLPGQRGLPGRKGRLV
jgi:hypothetical protein